MPTTRSRFTPRKKVTIHDIAREAKVSIGTVSRALNNAHNINAETRERVMSISRRLGMRPRGPARRKHFAILVPDRDKIVGGGYVDILVQELLYALSRHGCALSVFTDRQADEIGHWLFDGIFSASWSQLALDTVATLKDTPTIAINYTADRHPAFHVVGWDHKAEGRMVGEYFLERGHRLRVEGVQHLFPLEA
ncbi:MAG: LacI family DNA-binding transcriptional regulator, partial [Verrucomicrobiota bacterium]